MTPKISIVIPTYNAETMLEGALQSVTSQTYPNKEIIVIDGASTDGTVSVIDRYLGHIRHFVSEKDSGIYNAMNKGILAASGEYVYFLGADDRLYDADVLAKIFSNEQLRDADIIYGNVKFIPSGRIYKGEFKPANIARANICHQAMFIKRDLFERYGLYEEKYAYLADWVFNIKHFCDPNVRYKYVNILVANYSQGGRSEECTDLQFKKDRYHLIVNFLPNDAVEAVLTELNEELGSYKKRLAAIDRSFAGKIARIFVRS